MDGMVKKVVILAGGYGTRLAEETELRPKPMIEIGGRPILWHIMKTYSHFGVNEFIICLGYKGYMIKDFFAHYHRHMSDITFDMRDGTMEVHNERVEPWRVTLIDTGSDTMTGGRLKLVRDYIGNETFCMTYGDGLADIRIDKLIAFHEGHGRLATVSAVRPPGRFGALELQGQRVHGFIEKPLGDGGYINGGFFVLSHAVIDTIADEHTIWEQEPMKRLARSGELQAYEHCGFWHPMDTLRDKRYLEELWASGHAPWKTW
jgi:glucose-1-phosphate cytidylyltransferase